MTERVFCAKCCTALPAAGCSAEAEDCPGCGTTIATPSDWIREAEAVQRRRKMDSELLEWDRLNRDVMTRHKR